MHATCAVRIIEVDAARAGLLAGQRLRLEHFRSALPVSGERLRLLIAELESKATDLSRTMAIVRRDASLAFQILALANISSSEDCDLTAATVLTGTARLRALVRRISAVNKQSAAPPESLARHSQLAAALARTVAQLTGSVDPETAYLGGLLHDIGKLVLLDTEGAEHNTQREAGAWLAAAWGLPQPIAACIAHHHDYRDGTQPANGLLACVRLADSACNLLGVTSAAFAFVRFDSELDQDRRQMESLVRGCFPDLSSRSTTNLAKALEAEFLNWILSSTTIAQFLRIQPSQGGVQ